MNAPWPLVAAMGLLGLLIGSFLNVVIYRVPRDLSVIAPPSACPSCGTMIKARHNVPVLSWLALKGKCAYCSAPIGARYPLVEAGTAALFATITAYFGVTMQLPAYLYLAAVGITVAMIDFDKQRLPDTIVLPSYVIAALLLMPAGAVDASWTQSGRALAGMAALLVIYFALAVAYPQAVPLGDVKLAGLVGLYLGWLSWTAITLGILLGFVLAVFAGTAGHHRAADPNGGEVRIATVVPLGTCLVAGSVLALFLAAPLTGWYGSVLSVS